MGFPTQPDFNIFYEEYGDELLTKDEYQLIFNSMDRKDYTKEYPQFDRYIDLERIKKEIAKEKKKRNDDTELKDIILKTYIDGTPPYNFYTYTFDIPVFRDESFREFYKQYKCSRYRLSPNDVIVLYNAYNEFKNKNFNVSYMIKDIERMKFSPNVALDNICISKITETMPPRYKYQYTLKPPIKQHETFDIFYRNNSCLLKDCNLTLNEIELIWKTGEFNKIKDKIIRTKHFNGNKILKNIILTGITESHPPHNIYKYVF
jgi:hypothetical protein